MDRHITLETVAGKFAVITSVSVSATTVNLPQSCGWPESVFRSGHPQYLFA